MNPDLQNVLDACTAAEREAAALVDDLSHEQFNWRPNNGLSWSIAQCIDHLARTNVTYSTALREAVDRTDLARCPRCGPIQPGWFSRKFLSKVEPPVTVKVAAPKKVTPVPECGKAETLAAFVKSHDPIRQLVRDTADVDLNRIRFKNPFFRFLPFTVGTGLLIINGHDRRHLWQIRRIRELTDFPHSSAPP
jgi:hypothetical protein